MFVVVAFLSSLPICPNNPSFPTSGNHQSVLYSCSFDFLASHWYKWEHRIKMQYWMRIGLITKKVRLEQGAKIEIKKLAKYLRKNLEDRWNTQSKCPQTRKVLNVSNENKVSLAIQNGIWGNGQRDQRYEANNALGLWATESTAPLLEVKWWTSTDIWTEKWYNLTYFSKIHSYVEQRQLQFKFSCSQQANQWFSKCLVPWPSASSGNVLEMQVLRLQSKPAAPDFWVEPKNLNFTSLPGDSDASSLRNTGLDEDY